MTQPNVYGIDSCYSGADSNLCGKPAEEVMPLLTCALDKILDFGFNGYQFTDLYPLAKGIFGMGGEDLSALDFLASYCVNGAHADDLFCQVDPKITDATCGTPIVLQVLAPQPDGTMCEQSEACTSVLPTDPTFSKLLVDQFVCIVSFQSPDISEGIYKGIACYLGQVLEETDLTGYAVRDQVETVKSQLLTVGGCSA
ncbi:uncharacterized protein LOC8033409 [Ixodes scapularis]|uniref:uncharacterized protein LOC8033409 n=1 Tax=Ixodes scapularis TaxID=6945 RepID=UPI001A9DFD24|nr:uncharacterized protein LOC8033409 [Ixodes scapularis]